jgi:hypothetical protein
LLKGASNSRKLFAFLCVSIFPKEFYVLSMFRNLNLLMTVKGFLIAVKKHNLGVRVRILSGKVVFESINFCNFNKLSNFNFVFC